jgi:tetratricopeptide (TPR) repeat protein
VYVERVFWTEWPIDATWQRAVERELAATFDARPRPAASARVPDGVLCGAETTWLVVNERHHGTEWSLEAASAAAASSILSLHTSCWERRDWNLGCVDRLLAKLLVSGRLESAQPGSRFDHIALNLFGHLGELEGHGTADWRTRYLSEVGQETFESSLYVQKLLEDCAVFLRDCVAERSRSTGCGIVISVFGVEHIDACSLQVLARLGEVLFGTPARLLLYGTRRALDGRVADAFEGLRRNGLLRRLVPETVDENGVAGEAQLLDCARRSLDALDPGVRQLVDMLGTANRDLSRRDLEWAADALDAGGTQRPLRSRALDQFLESIDDADGLRIHPIWQRAVTCAPRIPAATLAATHASLLLSASRDHEPTCRLVPPAAYAYLVESDATGTIVNSCRSLAFVLFERAGDLPGALALYDRCLHSAEAGSSAVQEEMWTKYLHLATLATDVTVGERTFQEAIGQPWASSSAHAIWRAQFAVFLCNRKGDLASATDLLRQARTRVGLVEAGAARRYVHARILAAEALMTYRAGDLVGAIERLRCGERSLRGRTRNRESENLRFRLQMHLARVHARHGASLDAVSSALALARRVAVRLNDRAKETQVMWRRANCNAAAGRYVQADRWFRQALRFGDLTNDRSVLDTCRQAAAAFWRAGDHARACRWLHRLARAHVTFDSVLDAARLLSDTALRCHRVSRDDLAEDALQLSWDILDLPTAKAPHSLRRAVASRLSFIAMRRNRWDEAVRFAREAVGSRDAEGDVTLDAGPAEDEGAQLRALLVHAEQMAHARHTNGAPQ